MQLPNSLTDSQKSLIDQYLRPETALWLPLPGPQLDAYVSQADELFFGGSAGGGKTDLLLGLAMTAHGKAIIFRREYAQLTGADSIVERSKELLSDIAQFNARDNIWREIPGNRIIEFGAVQYEDDKNKYKGHSHDLKAFDEVSEFTESQYRFLIGWARTIDPNQRVRVVATGNPPTRAEGEWVIKHWGPWLDSKHPNPAAPGELRWFAVIEGEDREVKNGEPLEHKGETIKPKSRTFIPARLSDNPYLARTGYATVLQGLPEPLRSQLLYGDFNIAIEDNPWQVIPTEWVRLAQGRWKEREKPDTPLTAVGVDGARGGKDKSVISKRYDNWFAPLLKYPGSVTPDGPAVAGLVIKAINGESPDKINVDVIGIGSSIYDSLKSLPGIWAVNFAEGTKARDKSGRLGMRNIRAEAYWKAREALDPVTGDDLALPPDDELLADLVAHRWKVTAQGIQIESKEDIVKRLKRSPDCSDAFVLALTVWGGWSFG